MISLKFLTTSIYRNTYVHVDRHLWVCVCVCVVLEISNSIGKQIQKIDQDIRMPNN